MIGGYGPSYGHMMGNYGPGYMMARVTTTAGVVTTRKTAIAESACAGTKPALTAAAMAPVGA